METFVFFDLETQKLSDEVGGWFPKKMGMSIAVTYEYGKGYKVWDEGKIENLVEYLESFQFIVGYNLLEFDYEVLNGYIPDASIRLGNNTIDLLQLIHENLGHRVSLNEIAKNTLGQEKGGDGKNAVKLWRNNKMEALVKYCRQDVRICVLLFEYIQDNGFVLDEYNQIHIELPEQTIKIERKMNKLKMWIDGYFESLLLSPSISKEQIKLLREKVNELMRMADFDNEASEDDEEPYTGDVATVDDDLPF